MTQQEENLMANTDSLPPRNLGAFPINTVQCQDCIEGMGQIPDNSVDLVIADPPYNTSKGNIWKWDNSVELPGFGGNWSKIMEDWDNKSLSDYFAFTLAWLTEVKRIVRPTGSIWAHGTFHNNGVINFAMQLLEIEIINEVVWYKRNSFPNLSGRRLTASHETILWAHTGGKKRNYFFDYDAAKGSNLGADIVKTPGKQLRTGMGHSEQQGAPRTQPWQTSCPETVAIDKDTVGNLHQTRKHRPSAFCRIGIRMYCCQRNREIFLGIRGQPGI